VWTKETKQRKTTLAKQCYFSNNLDSLIRPRFCSVSPPKSHPCLTARYHPGYVYSFKLKKNKALGFEGGETLVSKPIDLKQNC